MQVSTTKAVCVAEFCNLQRALDFQRGICKVSRVRKLHNLLELLLLQKSSLLHKNLKKYLLQPWRALRNTTAAVFSSLPSLPLGFFLLAEKTDGRVPQKQNQETAPANREGKNRAAAMPRRLLGSSHYKEKL